MSVPAVVLIGPMGSGKSSLGRKLSKRLGRPYIDTDRQIAADNGPIPQIFSQHGEEGFRAIERDVVAASLADGYVVSLGGGAVLDESTRANLTGCNVVLLTVSQEAVAARLGGSVRPLIADGGLTEWRRIWESRRALYEELADLTLDTSDRPMSHVVDDVVAWLERVERPGESPDDDAIA